MPFEIDSQHSIRKQIRKIAARQLAKAFKALNLRSKAPARQDEAVHTARKRIKEVRALIRLMRDDLGEKTFKRDNTALRDASRPLSEIRDATALIDSLKSLQTRDRKTMHEDVFKSVRLALISRRQDIRQRVLQEDQALGKAAAAIEKVRERVDRWNLQQGARKAIHAGLRRTYAQGRKAMRNALKAPSDRRLHDWRKRAKDLRYQLELLEPLWPDSMKTTARQAYRLTELLGDDHDLAVLRGLMDGAFRSLPEETAATLRTLIDQRRKKIQASARSLSERVYAESPARFVGRVKAR